MQLVWCFLLLGFVLSQNSQDCESVTGLSDDGDFCCAKTIDDIRLCLLREGAYSEVTHVFIAGGEYTINMDEPIEIGVGTVEGVEVIPYPAAGGEDVTINQDTSFASPGTPENTCGNVDYVPKSIFVNKANSDFNGWIFGDETGESQLLLNSHSNGFYIDFADGNQNNLRFITNFVVRNTKVDIVDWCSTTSAYGIRVAGEYVELLEQILIEDVYVQSLEQGVNIEIIQVGQSTGGNIIIRRFRNDIRDAMPQLSSVDENFYRPIIVQDVGANILVENSYFRGSAINTHCLPENGNTAVIRNNVHIYYLDGNSKDLQGVGQIRSTWDVKGSSDNIGETFFYNNLLRCMRFQSTIPPVVTYFQNIGQNPANVASTSSVRDLSIFNNVFIDCNIYVNIQQCSKTEILVGTCESGYNYLVKKDNDVGGSPSFTVQAGDFVYNDTAVIVPYDDIYKHPDAGYPEQFVPYAIYRGFLPFTPGIDPMGKIRSNTLEPSVTGPFGYYLCKYGWEGLRCDCNSDSICSPFIETNEPYLFAYEDIRAKDSINVGSGRRYRSLEEISTPKRTIRNVCTNEYWGIFIDTDDKLWMWGEEIDNDYIEFDTTTPTEIDYSEWEGVPKKVSCTESSVFILTHHNVLYKMGKNKHLELGETKLTEFTKDLNHVYDVQTSYHSVYVSIDFAVNQVYDVMAMGANFHGCLGVDSDREHTGVFPTPNTWQSMYDYIFDELGFGVVGVDPLGPPNARPRIKPMEHGVAIKYHLGDYAENLYQIMIYAGKDHPSLGEDVKVPRIIDFDDSDESQFPEKLEAYRYEVDFIDRIIGGCMYLIVSDMNTKGDKTRIYVSGSDCTDDVPGVVAVGETNFPTELTPYQYGDYEGELIYQFFCSFACYINTREKIYMFGVSEFDLGLGADCGEDENCNRITDATSVFQHVHAGWRNTAPNYPEQNLKVYYNVFPIEKPTGEFNVYDPEETYFWPPELLYEESHLREDVFYLKFRKKEVFEEMYAQIDWEYGDIASFNYEKCMYPKIGESWWQMWNDANGVGEPYYDYYLLEMDWETIRTHCGWILDESFSEYDIYRNNILFTELFYNRMRNAQMSVKKEHFIFRLDVRFKKEIMSVNVNVLGDPEWWDAYIVEKTFDRATRKGRVVLMTVTRYPNYLVFADLADDTKNRLGEITPSVPEYFYDYEIFEKNGESMPPGPRRLYEIDVGETVVHQTWEFDFELIDDYRVCKVPTTTIPINWHSYCHDAEHYDCVIPEPIEFSIDIMIDNLCLGELSENILTEFVLELYTDWDYTTLIDVNERTFSIGEWLYFRAEVSAEKVDISESDFSLIKIVSNSVNIVLYDNSAIPKMTPEGDLMKMVIDDLSSNTVKAFHLKIVNDVVDLQPGMEEAFTFEVYMQVLYEGNPEVVDSNYERRADVNLGTTYTQQLIEIFIKTEESTRLTALPYVLLSVGVVFALFAIVVCIGIGVLITLFIVRKSQEKGKRQAKNIEMKKDEE